MIVQKTYKVRLYPNKSQEAELVRVLGACRFVWNHFLDKRKLYYAETKKSMSYSMVSLELTKLRRDTGWLRDVNSIALQQSLRRLETAYSRFFKKIGGLPRFKTKKEASQSFVARYCRISNRRLQIYKGLSVRFRGTAPPQMSELRSVSICRRSGVWYASISCKEDVVTKKKTGKPLGVDLGLSHLAITSTGKKYERSKPYQDSLMILRNLQRTLSRKKLGSKRREGAKVAVVRLHEKVRNRRMNHLHQTTHRITSKNHALIVCEDLSMKNMIRNTRLSKAIQDTGWGEFVRQLEYKQLWRGGELIKIDRFFPSSKTCSSCGFVAEKLPLDVRSWQCPQCKRKHDRDINAAKAILQEGLRNSRNAEGNKTVRKGGAPIEA